MTLPFLRSAFFFLMAAPFLSRAEQRKAAVEVYTLGNELESMRNGNVSASLESDIVSVMQAGDAIIDEVSAPVALKDLQFKLDFAR